MVTVLHGEWRKMDKKNLNEHLWWISNVKDIGINFSPSTGFWFSKAFRSTGKKVLKFKFLPVENSYQSILQALKTRNVVSRQFSTNFENFFTIPWYFFQLSTQNSNPFRSRNPIRDHSHCFEDGTTKIYCTCTKIYLQPFWS